MISNKLTEIQDLIDNQQLGALFIFDDSGIRPDLPLTPLGEFIRKLEHIVQRDEDVLGYLLKNLKP